MIEIDIMLPGVVANHAALDHLISDFLVLFKTFRIFLAAENLYTTSTNELI